AQPVWCSERMLRVWTCTFGPCAMRTSFYPMICVGATIPPATAILPPNCGRTGTRESTACSATLRRRGWRRVPTGWLPVIRRHNDPRDDVHHDHAAEPQECERDDGETNDRGIGADIVRKPRAHAGDHLIVTAAGQTFGHDSTFGNCGHAPPWR